MSTVCACDPPITKPAVMGELAVTSDRDERLTALDEDPRTIETTVSSVIMPSSPLPPKSSGK